MPDNQAQKRSAGRPRGKPRGMRRDRDCRSCKSRNVKCDLNRPRCLPCVQAGLPCGGYPQRIVWAGQGSASRELPQRSTSRNEAQAIPESDGPAGLSRGSATTDDQHSFVNRLAAFCHQIISVNGRNHGVNRYLSSEAISLVSHLSDFMQARIESRSAANSSGGDTGEKTESVDAARHRLAALVGLNEALREANPFALLAIAAFAFFEVYDSAFGEWQRHLYGARSLLDCHCRSRAELEDLSETVTGLTEIVARLVWFDTLGAIARQTTGLIFDDWHRGILNDAFFKVVGCHEDTFDLFIYVANMDEASNPVGSCILAMEQLLRLDASDSTDWGLSTNAHRCAAAIAVLGRIREETTAMSRQSAMASAVERICQIIAATPSSSQFYIHMAVPAYLAGMNATTPQQCDAVRRYWQYCNIARVPRYPGGLARCEEEWRAKGLAR
ncbi:hypothetical protein TOPH_07079 [Tolypocladium ophioglossoides CBS 100239]|uniref:Zn(2)-C6 fungal-type domain-containing protein n=1 Tax=Tolypocladium ophioglossoides (strain CBS 100239) TaxID=1163406 RepID=A0A0L0N2G4_TOLOC|nr:hypothetical protein TOPH_07079 [Tolypocladium ophioglossoides CBS 100239]